MLNRLWKYIVKNSSVLSHAQSLMFLAVGLGIYHLCLLALYVYYDIGILKIVNVVSVLLYAGCAYALMKQVKPLIILQICYGEIIVQVLIAGAMIGYQCGFQFYLVAITCHAFYTGYMYRNDDRVNPLHYILLEAVAFIILRWWTAQFPPLYSFRDSQVVEVLYVINYFTAIVVIVASMSMLLSQIIQLEGGLIQENKDLEVLSHTDALTGLENRRGMEEKYDSEIRHGERYALILGDIDDFKKINDTYGHNAGDLVLQEVAEIFKYAVRREDVVCRWGGEEILVLLPSCKKDGAELTAQRILDRVRQTSVEAEEGVSIRFTMTFGISDSDEGTEWTEIVHKADDRLYAGKAGGKNCVVSG